MTLKLKLKLQFRITITTKEGSQSHTEKKSLLLNLGLIMASYQLPLILYGTTINLNLLTLAKQPLASSKILLLLPNGKITNTSQAMIKSRKLYGTIKFLKEWLDMEILVHSLFLSMYQLSICISTRDELKVLYYAYMYFYKLNSIFKMRICLITNY